MQLDGSDHVEPLQNRLSERTEMQSSKLVCGSYPTEFFEHLFPIKGDYDIGHNFR